LGPRSAWGRGKIYLRRECARGWKGVGGEFGKGSVGYLAERLKETADWRPPKIFETLGRLERVLSGALR
jgi:hypothetical protein